MGDELDRMSGNITQHRLERLVMNDDIVQEEQGIFAALRNHAIQSQRDHGRVGVPALSGMDDMIQVRHAFGRKLKVVEQQLEEEHEDRIGFLREKHDMEGKILNLQEMLERSAEDEGLV